jgi:hypothetical protein
VNPELSGKFEKPDATQCPTVEIPLCLVLPEE